MTDFQEDTLLRLRNLAIEDFQNFAEDLRETSLTVASQLRPDLIHNMNTLPADSELRRVFTIEFYRIADELFDSILEQLHLHDAIDFVNELTGDQS